MWFEKLFAKKLNDYCPVNANSATTFAEATPSLNNLTPKLGTVLPLEMSGYAAIESLIIP